MSSLAEDQHQYNNLTHEAYFALEEELGQKFEYIAGEVFAMSGGSVSHSLIGTNTTTTLSLALRNKPCTVLNSDAKLRIDDVDGYFYPDAMVLCEDGEIEGNYVQLPQIIIEVLSPSTEDYDHNKKFSYYRQIKTLQTYIMLYSEKALAEVYQRCSDNSWLLKEYTGLDTSITLSDDLQLLMADLYRQVTFESLDNSES